MLGVNDLVELVFRGLSPLVIEEVVAEGEAIMVRARTPRGPGVCPGCGAESVRVHGYVERTVGDVPLDAEAAGCRPRPPCALRLRGCPAPQQGHSRFQASHPA